MSIVPAQTPAEAASQNPVPSPCTITPALLKQHSITPDEYTAIEHHLGRTPSLTELGIFSVMWSEHCSYKSSRVHLRRLPTKGTRSSGPGAVVQGPGENAGIIDVGDGWACAFKIESHNHPSYIEPYQGAATGVGGILRDIFTMGARPLAVMDSLRFGPLAPPPPPTLSSQPEASHSSPEMPSSRPEASHSEAGVERPPYLSSPTESQAPDLTDYAKNHHVANGVVHGVAGYGNCFGVPNLGGETRFEACYSGNPLLNAFALGLVRKDEIFYAAATGVGNPVFYVGAKTGRDGIHGATMASEEFTEGSEQKRPNVQMGDPFLEKLLLEACLEVMKTGAVLGIQDMGAAGLTCSTCEMGAKGELGVSIELDRVPQRESGMTGYEIMLSESQERMLLVAQKGREQEVLDVFAKWGLDCAEVGIVTADDVMRVHHHGVLIAEIPNKALTDNAPVYHRPVGTWTPPVPRDPPAHVLAELQKPRDYTADLLKLLASPNICDKRYIYEQYDSMVQTNTVQGPGFEAGVIRIKGTGPIPDLSSRPEMERSKDGVERSTSSITSTRPPSRPESERSADEAERPPHSHRSATPAHAIPTTLAEKVAASLGLDPLAADHSILGQIANFITGSTPEGVATEQTGNEDAANPVVAPDVRTHESFATTSTTLSSRPESEHSADAVERPASPSSPHRERGIAMALAGNGRWCYLDPKLGAMHAVAEAARKVACTGATPVAATNCLNFGNPEKPEIMAQLSLAIDGIAEACTALNTPITGGNVSLYNETRGEGIYPTPVIGVVGILEDVTKAVPNSFQRAGEAILILGETTGPFDNAEEFGSSEAAKCLFECSWGRPPQLWPRSEGALNALLAKLSDQALVTSASDISDGGLAVTLAKATVKHGVGVAVSTYRHGPRSSPLFDFFSEAASRVVVTCSKANVEEIREITNEFDIGLVYELGQTTTGAFVLSNGLSLERKSTETSGWNRDATIKISIADLRAAFTQNLPSQLAAEVVTA